MNLPLDQTSALSSFLVLVARRSGSDPRRLCHPSTWAAALSASSHRGQRPDGWSARLWLLPGGQQAEWAWLLPPEPSRVLVVEGK